LFSDITATSIIAIALTALLLSSSPLPSSFSFHSNTNRDFLAFASPSISGSQTTVQEPPPSLPPSPPSPAYPPLGAESTQSSQSPSGEGSGPSSDNFNLPAGYIIEPVLENLSMPTSIALDSENGTIYVAESTINEDDNNDNSSGGGILTSSSPHPGSFLSQQPQVRIVKADDISGVDNNDTIVNQTLDHGGVRIIGDDDNISTIVNTDLKWPVIDMEVDDASGLLYALHDHTTIWKINTTSGQREDILVPGEEPAAAAGSYEYEEEQQDPLSFLINSSSQIALSGKEDYDNGSVDGEQPGSNYDSYNFTTVLYIPCMNGHVDNNNSNYGTYCILGLPIDRSGNSAVVDNIGSVNSSSTSFILENMTSRPVGIAILNSSSYAATSSSSPSPYPSSPSTSRVTDQQSPYALTGSQIPSTLFNNSENDLLIITSQPTSNSSIFGNTNDDNYSELNRSSYGSSGSSGSGSGSYSSSYDDALSSLNTIYHAKVFDSIPYPGNSSNDLQGTIDNHINDNTNYGDSSNNFSHRQQTQPPSMEALSDYPYGQLGQVAVVSIPSTTTTTTTTISSS
jgi:hypothetical protein